MDDQNSRHDPVTHAVAAGLKKAGAKPMGIVRNVHYTNCTPASRFGVTLPTWRLHSSSRCGDDRFQAIRSLLTTSVFDAEGMM